MGKSTKQRLRRTMMFLNAQRAGLVKDAFIYGADSLILDLEDAVAENQKDSARFSLFHTLRSGLYGNTECFVRINGTDTPYWREDVRAAVAGNCDGIRVPKCETPVDVHIVEQEIERAEKEFGIASGSTMMMAAIESPLGVINACELASCTSRMMGVALGAGDYIRTLHARMTAGAEAMLLARAQIILAARAADVMCFDAVHTDIEDEEGLVRQTALIRDMGFDGKSIISPKQIAAVHRVFTPDRKEIAGAERLISAYQESRRNGVGVFTLDGKMVDIAMLEGAQRTLRLAKAAGCYKGVVE